MNSPFARQHSMTHNSDRLFQDLDDYYIICHESHWLCSDQNRLMTVNFSHAYQDRLIWLPSKRLTSFQSWKQILLIEDCSIHLGNCWNQTNLRSWVGPLHLFQEYLALTWDTWTLIAIPLHYQPAFSPNAETRDPNFFKLLSTQFRVVILGQSAKLLFQWHPLLWRTI